uniref:Uncharacterized protein n=1 Tax=Caenorhabditis japonica TaxID=281687 RepID=A0A8R1E8P5_CAEJA
MKYLHRYVSTKRSSARKLASSKTRSQSANRQRSIPITVGDNDLVDAADNPPSPNRSVGYPIHFENHPLTASSPSRHRQQLLAATSSQHTPEAQVGQLSRNDDVLVLLLFWFTQRLRKNMNAEASENNIPSQLARILNCNGDVSRTSTAMDVRDTVTKHASKHSCFCNKAIRVPQQPTTYF